MHTKSTIETPIDKEKCAVRSFIVVVISTGWSYLLLKHNAKYPNFLCTHPPNRSKDLDHGVRPKGFEMCMFKLKEAPYQRHERSETLRDQ